MTTYDNWLKAIKVGRKWYKFNSNETDEIKKAYKAISDPQHNMPVDLLELKRQVKLLQQVEAKAMAWVIEKRSHPRGKLRQDHRLLANEALVTFMREQIERRLDVVKEINRTFLTGDVDTTSRMLRSIRSGQNITICNRICQDHSTSAETDATPSAQKSWSNHR